MSPMDFVQKGYLAMSQDFAKFLMSYLFWYFTFFNDQRPTNKCHETQTQKVNGDMEGKPLAFLLLVQQLSSLLRFDFNFRSFNRAW